MNPEMGTSSNETIDNDQEYLENDQQVDNFDPENSESLQDYQQGEILEELEDITIDGKTFRVNKDVKPYLMRHSDYTQKTMSVAEERRAVAAEREAIKQSAAEQQQLFEDLADFKALDKAVKQYEQVDWTLLSQNDPVQWQQLWSQYNKLQQQRNSLGQQLDNKRREVKEREQQETARTRAEHQTILLRDIPDWTPEKEKQIKSFVVNTYGIDAAEVDGVFNSQLLKIFNDAFIGKQLMKGRTTNQPLKLPVKPAAVVNGKRSQPNTKYSTDESMEDYMKRRRRV